MSALLETLRDVAVPPMGMRTLRSDSETCRAVAVSSRTGKAARAASELLQGLPDTGVPHDGEEVCAVVVPQPDADVPSLSIIVVSDYAPSGPEAWDDVRQTLAAQGFRQAFDERLNWLVAQGVLARREYSTRPVRHEYLLTDKGMELCDLLLVMVRWGDRWTAGQAGPPTREDDPPARELATLRRQLDTTL